MIEVEKEILLSVLKKYNKEIIHMRQELNEKYRRFSLVCGAGIGKDLGFPNWNEFVLEIAKHNEIDAFDMAKREIKKKQSLPKITQMLFHIFLEKHLDEKKTSNETDFRFQLRMKANWIALVHGILYKNVPESIEEIKKADNYLQNFLPLIKKSKVTINYNFDDTLERLINDFISEAEKLDSKGYRTAMSSNVKLYPGANVIYHPNGFIPFILSEHHSPEIVFQEDSFADQFREILRGDYTFLHNHLAQNTCLLVGLSLNDESLKHILHENAIKHPGQIHYYIKYISENQTQEDKAIKPLIELNFKNYNLITLQLTKKDHAALGFLLSMEDSVFDAFVYNNREIGFNKVYRYFITGSVGVGKTTIQSQLLSFEPVDEFFENLYHAMIKEPSKVTSQDHAKIDNFVTDQWCLKNRKLYNSKSGIFIIDRAPLDLFAFPSKKSTFIDKNEWIRKAKLQNEKIKLGNQKPKELVSGHIFLLIGEPEIMEARSLAQYRKDYSVSSLYKQQELLKIIYDSKAKGVTIIDTREKDLSTISREIVKTIYFENYEVYPLQQCLSAVINGSWESMLNGIKVKKDIMKKFNDLRKNELNK